MYLAFLCNTFISEDASRSGYGVEDMDITSIDGDLPMSASVLVDTTGVSDSPTVAKLQELARLKTSSERVVNVVNGANLLSDYEVDYYFTAAFPTIFPYGSSKHLDGRRHDQLSLSCWIQLLLKHSSRRFQRHNAFVALAFDVTRRRHNSFKASIGKRADPNSVRPGTRPIGRYTGRVSGWECCHPLRIGHSSGGLTEMQAKPDPGEAFEGRSGNCGWAGDPM